MNLAPLSKGQLAILLSKLTGFAEPKIKLEQYNTDSQVAADLLWTAFQLGDIQGKNIADFGAGTGILGIGALLLGATHVHFVESEKDAMVKAQENLRTVTQQYKISGTHSFIHGKVEAFAKPVECIIQNPPFGTRAKGADTAFLRAAFKNSPVVYSFHKTVTRSHIQKMSTDSGFTITHLLPYQLPLKATLPTHTKKIHRIDVTAFRLEKSKGI